MTQYKIALERWHRQRRQERIEQLIFWLVLWLSSSYIMAHVMIWLKKSACPG